MKFLYGEVAYLLPVNTSEAALRCVSFFGRRMRRFLGTGLLSDATPLFLLFINDFGGTRNWVWLAFHCLHFRIEVDGDNVTGPVIGSSSRRWGKGKQYVQAGLGRYIDTFKRVPDESRLSCVRFIGEGK